MTWLAVILCVILVIPAHMVGGVAEYIYQHSSILPDPFGLHLFFGIDWLVRPLAWILYGLGLALRGGIAGALAMAVTKMLCRRANMLKVAIITGIAYTVFVDLLSVASISTIGINGEAVATVIELIGLWIGMLAVSATAPQFEPSR